jgi:hypothetical protein
MKVQLIAGISSIIFSVLTCQSSWSETRKDKSITVAPICYNKDRIYPATGTQKTTRSFKWSDEEFEKAKDYLDEMIIVLPELNRRTDSCRNNDKIIAAIGFMGGGEELKKWDSDIPPEYKVDPNQITPDGLNIVFMFPQSDEITFRKMSYLYTFLQASTEE